MSSKKRKHWSVIIEEHGIRIRVYERAGSSRAWYSIMQGGRKIRGSLDTTDRALAQDLARAIAREVAEARFTGRDLRRITLGDVFSIYRTHRLPELASAWRRAVETRLEVFLEEWGADLAVQDTSQTHINRYGRRRMTGTLSAERTRKRKSVRAGTVDGELRWLSSVFNFARHHKVNGKRLLQENPLHDVKWEKEVNVRRPVASHHRFTETLKHVDTVDPLGRLRCMLSLARYTGRRESAICKLRASDFLRDPDAIRAALASMGFDENRADHMPHGAVRWREANDKQGFATISPLGATARAALDEYMITSPRLGDAWLFPGPSGDSKAIRREVGLRMAPEG